MTKYIIGKMLGVEAILLLIPMMVGLMYSEKESAYFLVASTLLCVCYFIWGRKEPEDTMIYTKEGLIIVAANLPQAGTLDLLVTVRSASIFSVRVYTEFYRRVF